MKSIQAPNFSDDQANIIGRELEIQDLIQKMTKNKREFKAWFKRYQELIAQRDQTIFTSDNPADE